MNEINIQKHSKSGIFSCLTAILTWIYLGVLVYLFYFSDDFAQFFNSLFSPRPGRFIDFNGLGTALILTVVLFFIIPIMGNLTGIVLAIIGLVQKKWKKIYAFIGFTMNMLIFAAGFIFNIIGIFSIEK